MWLWLSHSPIAGTSCCRTLTTITGTNGSGVKLFCLSLSWRQRSQTVQSQCLMGRQHGVSVFVCELLASPLMPTLRLFSFFPSLFFLLGSLLGVGCSLKYRYWSKQWVSTCNRDWGSAVVGSNLENSVLSLHVAIFFAVCSDVALAAGTLQTNISSFSPPLSSLFLFLCLRVRENIQQPFPLSSFKCTSQCAPSSSDDDRFP